MAITAFLTGITEPIEFAFLFVAPILYIIHAVLSGLAFGLTIFLGIKHGTSFAHGLSDYIIYYSLSENALLLIPLGVGYALMYYLLFAFVIRAFKLTIPGNIKIIAKAQ